VSPETHLLASWIIAAKTTDNPRDCRLVTFAGLAPDLDGLGLIVDLGRDALGLRPSIYYVASHHWLLHGLFGALITASLFACFARRRLRVALLAFLVFHLHLLCDLAGSRGPSPADLWPIYYLGPFSRSGMLLWSGQWRLDGWIHRYLTVALFLWALWLPVKLGHSVVGVFSQRADAVLVSVLRKWHAAWLARRKASI
jgi:inner membrane protein